MERNIMKNEEKVVTNQTIIDEGTPVDMPKNITEAFNAFQNLTTNYLQGVKNNAQNKVANNLGIFEQLPDQAFNQMELMQLGLQGLLSNPVDTMQKYFNQTEFGLLTLPPEEYKQQRMNQYLGIINNE